jgi:hypothetical protein
MFAFLHRCWLTLRAIFRFSPSDPHAVGPVRCVGCGWEGVSVVPVSSPHYDPETGCLDMLECPDCGLFLVCSQ